MEERRRKIRCPLNPSLAVIHPDTGEELGFAVDLSPQGMQMTAAAGRFKIGQEEQVFLLLPRPMFTRQSIEFEARCVWAKPGEDGAAWCYGFLFTEVGSDVVGIIVSLIYENEESE